MRLLTSFLALAGLVAVPLAAQAADGSRLASLDPTVGLAPLADPGCLAAHQQMVYYSEQHGMLFVRWGAKRFDTPGGRSTLCVAHMQNPNGGKRYEVQFTLDGTPTGREVALPD
jgi:hypothetical protein